MQQKKLNYCSFLFNAIEETRSIKVVFYSRSMIISLLSLFVSVYIISMKFFLEFVSCCGSCSAGKTSETEEKRFLIVQETPCRRHSGHRRSRRLRGGRREWRPSLSSISEDNVSVAERKTDTERWRRNIKRRVSSLPLRNRTRSLNNYDAR